MNICLLCKWLWKLGNEDGAWQNILKKKYLPKEILTQAMDKPGSSQFWSGLMKVKPIFNKFCERILVYGNKTRFWEDVWVNKKTLAVAFLGCMISFSIRTLLLIRWFHL
jgi:hypothetical protein